LDELLARLPEGFEPASPLAPEQRSHLLCFRALSPEATARAHRRLLAAQVVTSLRGGRIRVAPHLYSSRADLDRLLAAAAAEP
jgi:selenocysteine lyase/cysteine desulfurase